MPEISVVLLRLIYYTNRSLFETSVAPQQSTEVTPSGYRPQLSCKEIKCIAKDCNQHRKSMIGSFRQVTVITFY